MAANLEEYTTYYNATKEEFDAWNEQQPPNKKIMNRLPWTLEFGDIKFSDGFEKKPFEGKDGKAGGVNTFKKVKFVKGGVEVGGKVQSPSVIAPKGYTTVKTDNGPLKVIICYYDTTQVEHKKFLDNIEAKVTTPAVYEIIRNAGAFGFQDFPAMSDFSAHSLESEQMKGAISNVRSKMAKIVNRIKLNKTTVDFTSPLRTIFYSPMYFVDKEKPGSLPVEMEVNLKTVKGQPARTITPAQLYQICEGWEEKEVPVQKMVNGYMQTVMERKLIKGEPKGMECSPEANFIKLNVGSKPSTKMSCTSITITRFQVAPRSDTQGSKNKAFDEYGVEDDFTAQLNMESLLAGLANAANAQSSTSQLPVGGGSSSFNPMGVDSNISSSQTGNGGSLLGALSSQQVPPQQQNQYDQHQYHPQPGINMSVQSSSPPSLVNNQSSIGQNNSTVPQINVPGVGISQQAPPSMPQPFNGANFGYPSQLQGSVMPGVNTGMGIPNIPTQQNLGLDRLQTFNLGGMNLNQTGSSI